MNKFSHEDSIDPNKESMFPDLSVEQRDFLRASISSLPGVAGSSKKDHFGQYDLVEDLKKNPLFNDKSRMTLYRFINQHSKWTGQIYFRYFHPEQEDFLRTCLLFLDDCDWKDSTGKKITKKRVADELSKFHILSDKTANSIYEKIRNTGKWL